ncbi:MAG TPA: glycosyltransferase family 4 protein [Gemmatimonadales bacterium]|jgi:glycosyltransferase involved in cell wall biosynthesis|nr:glycosyltransferase family 4 protein [Gemmatimonadales bacterium]
MRVLLLDYDCPPRPSGAGAISEALARGLASRGLMVDVVTTGERSTTESQVLWNGGASEEGLLTVHRVKSGPGYLLAALPLLRRLTRGAPYDLVHLFLSAPTAALLPLLNLGDVPVIVSLHRADDVGPRGPTERLARVLLIPFHRWTWRRADRLVAASESLGHLALRGSANLRYSVVQGGVDLARFHPVRTFRRSRSTRIRCLAVAGLSAHGGVADLLHALALLERDRFELEIVGTGPEESRLRALAAKLGVAQEVIFRAPVGSADLAERYRAADLFTVAPAAEFTGSGFAEALASGLPIVGSSVGAIPELVEHGSNGLLVRPGDVRAIADAIARLAADLQLRREMGRRNRLKAKATLDWSRITERWLSLYAGVQRRRLAPARPAEIPSGTW